LFYCQPSSIPLDELEIQNPFSTCDAYEVYQPSNYSLLYDL